MMEIRGIRNCNPGNLRITADKWKGLRAVQDDGAFCQFESMKYGYRALLITLQNYRKKHGLDTLRLMIHRWAPPNENNTAAYLKTVCQELQVPDSYVIDIEDKDSMCALAAAISKVENGVPAIMSEVKAGWDLI